MRRTLMLLSVVIPLVILSLARSANAVSITVKVEPEVVSTPGGTTTIIVSCDKNATGSITVITPSKSASVVPITVPANGSVSKVYPTAFPGGSTSELGEYEVWISLTGLDKPPWRVVFWVVFLVVPESPIGTLMAVGAPFGATAALVKMKRSRLIH